MMIAEPALWLLVGFILHKIGISFLFLFCMAITLLIVSFSMKWRKETLMRLAREREEAEHEAAIRGAARDAKTLNLSTREKVLLEELDCRNWLDDTVTKIYNKYRDDLSLGLKNILDGVLSGLCPLGPIDSLVFSRFDLGKFAPKIVKVIHVRLTSASEAMLDIELSHVGAVVDVELLARLGGESFGVTIPILLSSISLEAIARIKVQLVHRSPYIGVLDIAFAQAPSTLDFNLKALVELTGLPSVVPLISNLIKSILNDLMVWPKRITLPLDEWFHPTTVPPRVARGILRITIDRGNDLPAADLDGSSDPYVTLEYLTDDGMAGYMVHDSNRTSHKSKTLFPVWNEAFAFQVLDPKKDKIKLQVFDYDTLGTHDLLGTAEISSDIFKELASTAHQAGSYHRTRRFWIRLTPPEEKQKLRLRLSSSKSFSLPPSRIRLEVSYGVLMPQKFPSLDEVSKEEDGTEESKQENENTTNEKASTTEEQSTSIVQEAKEELIELEQQDTFEQAQDLDTEILRRLYRRGQVCLKAGFVKKEGFSGLRQWRKRWLELELILEYQEGEADPAVAASLRYFKSSDDRGDDMDERDANDKAKPVGEVRLGEHDELNSSSDSGSFELRAGGKLWRIKKCSSDDTDPKDWTQEWTDVIKRALGCVKMDRVALAHHVRSAAASMSYEPSVKESGGATLVVEIFEARGLVAADKSGLSDPFVLAKLGNQSWQSRTLRQTLEPKWFEYTEFWAGYNDTDWAITSSKRANIDQRDNSTPLNTNNSTASQSNRKESATFGGFDLMEGVLELQVMDEDSRGKSELLGSLLVPLVDLLPIVRSNSTEIDEFTYESQDAALEHAFNEPPKPQWFPLHPPNAHTHRRISFRRQRDKKKNSGAGNFDDESLGAGEILLRLTLRKFEVAKLNPLRRISHSVKVIRAVQNFAAAAHHHTAALGNAAVKGTASGVNAAVKGTTTAAKAAANLAARTGRPLSMNSVASKLKSTHSEKSPARVPVTSQ